MAAPTFVAEYEVSSWDTTTTPKTVTPTTAAGDVLAVLGGTENGNTTLDTPTGNSLTYTLRQSIAVNNWCGAYVWTATDAAGGTGWTLSGTRAGTAGKWGFSVLRFSGSDGIGASAITNVDGAAPSLGITTTQDNSAIAVIVLDWNATDGATRTWRTVNSITPTAGNGLERVYFRNAANYTMYAAYYSDAGAAGAKTVGLSAPAGQKYSIIAVEIKGTAAGGITHLADASLTATADRTAAAQVTKPVDASRSTTATVTATGASTKPVDTTLTGTATITAAATRVQPLDTSLTTAADVTAAAAATKPIDASLTVTATITADATVGAPPVEIAASPTFTASLTAAAARVAVADATLAATATLTASVTADRPGDTSLTVGAATTATAALTKPLGASLAAVATITATAAVVGPVQGGEARWTDRAGPIAAYTERAGPHAAYTDRHAATAQGG